MIRFIDLRGAETGYEFAFWDTVTDKFISINSDQAWDSISDLKGSAKLEEPISNYAFDLERLIRLCPDWVTVLEELTHE